MVGRTLAVKVTRACKYYGTEGQSDYKSVLHEFNMTVEKGHIYGLLGPSGCGKTTLLSCIVGRRQLNSGEVWVLGGRPGEKGSGIPGPRVGYMPQEIALVGELSIREAVYYFGRIYGMEMKKLSQRFEFLHDLLELPPADRQVKAASGGQQRRISMAAALVHEPELLIMDEPTVGLDPVLRDKIWNFLADLGKGGTTVIITTHYIDETKQADRIGLLRDGQLLAEESPQDLMRKLECENLEEAFLQLATRHHELKNRRPTLTTSPDVIPDSALSLEDSPFSSREDFNGVTSSTDVLTKRDNIEYLKGLSRSRYRAVLIKNLQQFCWHPSGLVFSIMFPLLQVLAFFLAVGHDPRHMKIAVVNDEAAFSPLGLDICKNSSLQPIVRYDNDTCQQYMLSCWLLEEMENFKIYQKNYDTVEKALHKVHKGKRRAAMYIPRNFSEAFEIRIREGNVEDSILNESSIALWIDNSDNTIRNFLKYNMMNAYNSFARRIMAACGLPEGMVQVPVHFHQPIYGKTDAQFSTFMAPGVMMTVIFFLPAIVTSTLIIGDRLEGVWERSAVAGVKAKEMLNVHIFIQSTIILVQTVEMMTLAYVGYGLENKGSIFHCGMLLFLQGLNGMCYGFLLSILCSSYTLSFFISSGSFYPMILLCGIVWPLEGMPGSLYCLAVTLPFTMPTQALRNIMEKGYAFSDSSVFVGYIITLAWIAGTLALCFLRLRYQKN